MSKILILVLFVLGAFVATAQQCPNNLVINGDLESGTPTAGDQDIGNATGFSRIWLPRSWADYYDAASGPFLQPAPPSGNYASCWISTSSNWWFREGFQIQLNTTILPNTGIYTLTFESSCLDHSWGTVDVGIYGVNNPGGGDAPNPPTSSTLPTNLGLFGAANTIELGTFQEDATSCTNNRTTRTIIINTNVAGYPAAGITHLFITRADGSPSGGIYAGFDNFCLVNSDRVCPRNFFANGDAEDGIPTAGDQDIGNAVGFSRIWLPRSWADYYNSTSGPFGPPTPADGDYVSCWISTSSNVSFREGFQVDIGATLLPNTGVYNLSFESACLTHSWGTVDVGVYGVDNPGGGDAPNPPTSSTVPSNLGLFGTGTTVLIGSFQESASTCTDNSKTMRNFTINTNAAGFPAGGITHIFITRADGSPSGGVYSGFDNFCLTRPQAVPCPSLGDYQAECIEDVNDDGVPDYQVTIFVANDAAGSISFSTSCGTVSPNPLTLTGAGTYNLVVTSNGTCSPFNVSFAITDASGNVCDQGNTRWELPPCKNPCVCDKNFRPSVNAGFNHVEDCPNDFFTPLALVDPCDRVDWFVDGSYVGSSVGNATFTMPHINGSYTLCMTVTRNDAVNQVACRETFCMEINPRLFCRSGSGSSLRLQVQPNPANQQVVVSWSTENIPDVLNVDVYNAQGVRVLSMPAVNGHNGQLTLDISTLAEGIYYIHATGEGYRPAPIKLIKQ